MRFCPRCGKETTRKETFCADCAPSREFTYKDITITVSPSMKYLVGNSWKSCKDVTEAIEKTAQQAIKTKQRITLVNTTPTLTEVKDGQLFPILLTVKIGNQYADIPAKFWGRNSPDMKTGTYYEGVLQLRNADEHIIGRAKAMLKRERAHLAKEVHVQNGIDLYLSPRKAIDALAKHLRAAFGGTYERHAQLFSRNTQSSRDIFRLNIILNFPALKKGTFFLHNHLPFEVINTGKSFKVKNVQSGSSTSIRIPHTPTILAVYTTTITKIRPHLEAMHPLTFQSEPIVHADKKECVLGHTVQVILHGGLWVVRS
ncbi:MAG: NMD3-related protein [archaeon]